jgi:hypothetical protein
MFRKEQLLGNRYLFIYLHNAFSLIHILRKKKASELVLITQNNFHSFEFLLCT